MFFSIILQNDDLAQFTDFYHQYKLIFFKYVIRFTNDQDTAEDIIQEAFILMAEKFYTLKDRTKFKSWGFKITANLCRQWYNKKKKENLIHLDNIENLPGTNENNDTFLENSNKEYLNQLLNCLTDEEKEIYILKHYENLNYQEIADLIHSSERTVRRRMRSASEKITKKVEKYKLVKNNKYFSLKVE